MWMVIIFLNGLRQLMVVLKMSWPSYTFMHLMHAAFTHRLLSDQTVWERESSIKKVLTVGFVFQGFLLIFCQQPGPTATVRNNLRNSSNHPVPYWAFTFIFVWSNIIKSHWNLLLMAVVTTNYIWFSNWVFFFKENSIFSFSPGFF